MSSVMNEFSTVMGEYKLIKFLFLLYIELDPAN